MDGRLLTPPSAVVPSRAVGNERTAKAFPGWPAERIEERSGIRERRYLWDIDAQGTAIPPPEEEPPVYPASNTDMCEVALRKALVQAGLEAKELDELNFNHDAMLLHQRLGCRADTFALVVDDGCGGTPYIIDMACKMMGGWPSEDGGGGGLHALFAGAPSGGVHG